MAYKITTINSGKIINVRTSSNKIYANRWANLMKSQADINGQKNLKVKIEKIKEFK